MIDEDRNGFITAFTEAVRPDDAHGRSSRRMFMVALATVLAAVLGALVYGAFGGKGAAATNAAPGPATAPGQTTATQGSTQGTWSAVAGPTCDGTGTSFTPYGYSTGPVSNQTTGWSTSSSGGYSGGGCGGGFVSMPMSGQAQDYDSTRSALWKFDFSAAYTSATRLITTTTGPTTRPARRSRRWGTTR
jgi:hypothetical protein